MKPLLRGHQPGADEALHPSGGGPGSGAQAGAGQELLVAAVLCAIIALQRVALPFGGGQVPIVLPVVVALVARGVHRGILEAEPARRQWFLAALVTCAAATTIVCWRRLPWSPLSIIYLALTYAPFMFRLRRPTTEQYHAALSLFLGLMTVAAVIGIGQIALQFVGVPFVDPFAALPSALVLHGYHTSYPVIYGSSIFKANGIFFLEPSFYSQFLALALVVHIHLRRRGLRGYLLMAGIIASVSGTGIILALSGILVLGLTERRRQVVRMAGGILVVAFLVAVSPAGSVFTSRIDESSSSTSSANGRFSVPYTVTASKLSSDPATLLSGEGPGDAERTSRQMEETGVTAVFPVVPKVALEYGVPAVVIFVAFFVTSTLRGAPSTSLALTALVMYFALSGSLLQPVTVYTVYALTSLFASDGGRSPATVGSQPGAFGP